MQVRLTLVSSGVTPAMRRGAFPAAPPDEVGLDEGMRGRAAALRPVLALSGEGTALVAPDIRAGQTAAALGLAAEPEHALRDQDFGTWSGRAIDEVGREDPQALAAWLTDPDIRPGGGESFSAVVQRVTSWLKGLRTSPGHMVAVTHAAVIRAAILAVIGAPPGCFARIDVAPLSLAELRGDGRRWMLRAMGVTADR
jgi:broad specificity phosphatase PhoE